MSGSMFGDLFANIIISTYIQPNDIKRIYLALIYPNKIPAQRYLHPFTKKL